MKKLNFKYLIISALILFSQTIASAQTPFKLDKTASKITILGTSSVHDWEIEITEFDCKASIAIDENKGASVSGVNVTCEVKDVKAENKIMTNKTYKALDGDDHPQISFKATDTAKATSGSASGIKGKLTIAGQSKDVTLPFTLTTENESTVKVSGKIPVKMSDFKIDPPTAMMGALKTADDIEIEYEIILIK